MDKGFIVLLAGKSGSGKTTIAEELGRRHGWKSVQSYTDRPMRYEGETGHVFVTPEEFDRIPWEKMVAYTEFSGHRYCATMDQAEECQVYVIDKRGIEEFREAYRRNGGRKQVVVALLSVPEEVCRERMRKRGDGQDAVEARIEHDREAFRGIEKLADVIYEPDPDSSPARCAEDIRKLILKRLFVDKMRHCA